ncbi:hypothetical protein BJ508DRAFT_304004 [Ascobolus immersus RN42]|uniref:Uncharacterized protein n=1 Tax=Ascobolus immersus RN42 TaxID=1160509 RepID=A0A3N4IHL2_ASCIM|nr:hypothetical protein BJ508DRAFT_304004 [Ascobolus immersus RN42]
MPPCDDLKFLMSILRHANISTKLTSEVLEKVAEECGFSHPGSVRNKFSKIKSQLEKEKNSTSPSTPQKGKRKITDTDSPTTPTAKPRGRPPKRVAVEDNSRRYGRGLYEDDVEPEAEKVKEEEEVEGEYEAGYGYEVKKEEEFPDY